MRVCVCWCGWLASWLVDDVDEQLCWCCHCLRFRADYSWNVLTRATHSRLPCVPPPPTPPLNKTHWWRSVEWWQACICRWASSQRAGSC